MKYLIKTIINLIFIFHSMPNFAASSYNEMNDIGGMGGSPLSLAALIGIAHSAPIIAISIYSKKKWLLITTTAVMIYVAFAAGKLSYVGYDLFFIAISTALSWFFITNEVKLKKPIYRPSINKTTTTPKLATSNGSKRPTNGFIIIFSLLAIGLFFIKISENKNIKQKTEFIQEAKQVHVPLSKTTEIEPIIQPKKTERPSNKNDIRNCLSLNSNVDIARCASNK